MPAERGVLVVSGGSRGIGAEVVSRAAADGWTVCFSYLEGRREADVTAEQVRAAGGEAIAVRADISVEDDVVALFETAAGQGSIRGFAANAAVVAPSLPLRDFSAERVRRVLEVNVLADAILWLLGDEASYCVGSVLDVAGVARPTVAGPAVGQAADRSDSGAQIAVQAPNFSPAGAVPPCSTKSH
jgi:NAD(P)-dependent dehydrogenase (short-subunit alcohol dehydrogenase family)